MTQLLATKREEQTYNKTNSNIVPISLAIFIRNRQSKATSFFRSILPSDPKGANSMTTARLGNLKDRK